MGKGDNQNVPLLFLQIHHSVGKPVELAPTQFLIDALPRRWKLYYSFDRRGYFEQEIGAKACLSLIIADRFA